MGALCAVQDHPIDPLNPVIRLGGCSYGELNPTRYPFYNIVAIHPDSSLLSGLEAHGCGACFEIQCVDRNPVRTNGKKLAVCSCFHSLCTF